MFTELIRAKNWVLLDILKDYHDDYIDKSTLYANFKYYMKKYYPPCEIFNHSEWTKQIEKLIDRLECVPC
jgi:hypothetical protein